MRKIAAGLVAFGLVGLLGVKSAEYRTERIIGKTYENRRNMVLMVVAAAERGDALIMTQAEETAFVHHLAGAIIEMRKDNAFFLTYVPNGDVERGVTWRNWYNAMQAFDATIQHENAAIGYLKRAIDMVTPRDPMA